MKTDGMSISAKEELRSGISPDTGAPPSTVEVQEAIAKGWAMLGEKAAMQCTAEEMACGGAALALERYGIPLAAERDARAEEAAKLRQLFEAEALAVVKARSEIVQLRECASQALALCMAALNAAGPDGQRVEDERTYVLRSIANLLRDEP